MKYVKDDNYYAIQGWFITRLNLSGAELLVFAIIYRFCSVDGVFKGSREYLAEWSNVTVRTVQTALNNLVDKGVIEKETYFLDDGTKRCLYKISNEVSSPSEINSPEKEEISSKMEKTSPSNKVYIKDNNKVLEKESKKKEIYFDNPEVNDVYLEFLEMRKDMKVKNTPVSIKRQVNELNKLSDFDKIKCIERSINCGWRGIFASPPKKDDASDWLSS